MSDKRAFGTPSGRKLFEVYDSRLELSEAGLHRLPQEDVCGTGDFGCDDLGNVINYTGAGGQDKQGELVEDQALFRGNAALAKSHETGKPVRVVRGPMKESIYAPLRGYRYDGLYTVTKYWSEKKKGVGGKKFVIWKFQLTRNEGQAAIPKNKGKVETKNENKFCVQGSKSSDASTTLKKTKKHQSELRPVKRRRITENELGEDCELESVMSDGEMDSVSVCVPRSKEGRGRRATIGPTEDLSKLSLDLLNLDGRGRRERLTSPTSDFEKTGSEPKFTSFLDEDSELNRMYENMENDALYEHFWLPDIDSDNTEPEMATAGDIVDSETSQAPPDAFSWFSLTENYDAEKQMEEGMLDYSFLNPRKPRGRSQGRAPLTKKCAACGVSKPEPDYIPSQWRNAGDARKCTVCRGPSCNRGRRSPGQRRITETSTPSSSTSRSSSPSPARKPLPTSGGRRTLNSAISSFDLFMFEKAKMDERKNPKWKYESPSGKSSEERPPPKSSLSTLIRDKPLPTPTITTTRPTTTTTNTNLMPTQLPQLRVKDSSTQTTIASPPATLRQSQSQTNTKPTEQLPATPNLRAAYPSAEPTNMTAMKPNLRLTEISFTPSASKLQDPAEPSAASKLSADSTSVSKPCRTTEPAPKSAPASLRVKEVSTSLLTLRQSARPNGQLSTIIQDGTAKPSGPSIRQFAPPSQHVELRRSAPKPAKPAKPAHISHLDEQFLLFSLPNVARASKTNTSVSESNLRERRPPRPTGVFGGVGVGRSTLRPAMVSTAAAVPGTNRTGANSFANSAPDIPYWNDWTAPSKHQSPRSPLSFPSFTSSSNTSTNANINTNTNKNGNGTSALTKYHSDERAAFGPPRDGGGFRGDAGGLRHRNRGRGGSGIRGRGEGWKYFNETK